MVARRSDGQITSIVRPGGGDHEAVYDSIGRTIEERERVDGQWQVTTSEYDLAGNLVARTLPNGMREEFDYDVYERIVSHRAIRDTMLEGEATYTYTNGQLSSQYDSTRETTESYSYDATGRLATVLYGNGETLTSGYDPRSRLTSERFHVLGLGVVADISYEYDQADRRIRMTDELAQEMLVERTYQNGRLVSTQTANGLTRSRTYDPVSGELVLK